VGASTGDFGAATSFDFSKDVEAGWEYLQSRPEIDRRKVGLVGHSEGGMIAPMVAARRDEVAFVVLLAGSGIRGDRLIILQQRLIDEAAGGSRADQEEAGRMFEGMYEIVVRSTDREQLVADLTAYFEGVVARIPEEHRGEYGEGFVRASVARLSSPWMRYFAKHDPVPTLERVKCPVLALNGEKDLQVPAEVNLGAIRAALARGGNERVETKVFPGLNHLFQECSTGLPMEYATIEQTFSPVVLDEMRVWIQAQTR
jgi:pimeloyl-ACP methyl ester carboxylesterase